MTAKLFAALTTTGAGWVLTLLIALSVLSLALMLDRLVYFLRFSSARSTRLAPLLLLGRLEEARAQLEKLRGMEGTVIAEALEAAPGGPACVEEVVAAAIARERLGFERYLSFFGTLGNNAPFLGLFGTVVGIIKAFADLSVGGPKAAGAAAVMGGISEALVATAVGIFVAIPAVVAFNLFARWLKTIVGRTQSLSHALVAYLQRDDVRAAAMARLGRAKAGATERPAPEPTSGHAKPALAGLST
jgi:biopolymer transport protein ExbB/TolQ